MATTTKDKVSGDGISAYGAPEGMVQYQLRIPPALKKALEQEALRLTEKFGVPVSTSGVMRKMLSEGLARARSTK